MSYEISRQSLYLVHDLNSQIEITRNKQNYCSFGWLTFSSFWNCLYNMRKQTALCNITVYQTDLHLQVLQCEYKNKYKPCCFEYKYKPENALMGTLAWVYIHIYATVLPGVEEQVQIQESKYEYRVTMLLGYEFRWGLDTSLLSETCTMRWANESWNRLITWFTHTLLYTHVTNVT